MLVGAGGNITLQIGDSGVLLVDTQYAQLSDKIVAAIRTLSDKPIRYIINTSFDADHTGGNESLAKIGAAGPGVEIWAIRTAALRSSPQKTSSAA